LQGTIVWVQENTEQDYNQREDGKNALVVVDGDDVENSPEESERLSAREDQD
jgi:hypothetical protein